MEKQSAASGHQQPVIVELKPVSQVQGLIRSLKALPLVAMKFEHCGVVAEGEQAIFTIDKAEHRRAGIGRAREMLDTLLEGLGMTDHALLLVVFEVFSSGKRKDCLAKVHAAVKAQNRRTLDAHMFGRRLWTLMDVQNLVRLAGLEDALVRTVFPVHMAWHLGMVRYLVTLASHNTVVTHAVGGLVCPIGGDDAVAGIDDNEGVVLGVDE